MKKIWFLIGVLLVLPILAHAKPIIDLQEYTSCTNEYCITRVDINKLPLTTINKEALKKADSFTLSSRFETTSLIPETNFKIDGSYLVVWGKIQKNTNNYWKIEFLDYILHPWWNYTAVETWNHSATWTPYNANSQNYLGFNMTTDYILTQISVKKHPSSNPFGCHAVAVDDTFVANGSYSGDNCVLTGDFVLGQYRIVNNYSSAGGACRYHNSFTYPNTSTPNGVFTIENCAIEDGTWQECGATQWWDFIDVNVSYAQNLWYETNLTLNGNESNITIFDNTSLVSVAMANLTMNVTIFINGSLYNTTLTGEASNTTSLSVGLYNVTAWFGNASTNDTITRYADIISVPIPPPGFSVFTNYSCIGNQSVYNESIVYVNGTNSTQLTYTYCIEGCNENNQVVQILGNPATLCNPTIIFQVIILLFIVIFMYLIVRWFS